MRHAPLVLIVLLVCNGFALAAPPPSYDDAALRAVQFVDDREGWAVGDDGVIWHSIDGGESWERQKTGTRATLTGVHFLTPYTGYICGRKELPGDLGSNGVLLATTDGGITWSEVASGVLPGLNAVKFFDAKSGIVCGDRCGAYPGGAFTTADGGKTWLPLVGPLGGSWLAVDGKTLSDTCFAGSWGQMASLREGDLAPVTLNIPGVRSIRAVKHSMAVGDGGLVLSRGADGLWNSVELPLPADARAVCDFHSMSVVGEQVWIAGRPGSVVLHSADAGKSWTIQMTHSQAPLHAIQMLDAKTGWAVGDLGTMLKTTDGGQTWKYLRGKLHAAVLGAHATPKSVPLTMYPVIGAAEGYITATLCLTSADPSADPKRTSDPHRLSMAMRLAGGAASETGWAFPLPAHCEGLTPDQLRAYWDGLHDGKAAEQMVRQLTLAIRMWRPSVIVTDSVMPDAPAAEQLMLAAMKVAYERAVDPAAYPEQIEVLGLKAHAAKKLYGRSYANLLANTISATGFLPQIADSPDALCAQSKSILQIADRKERSFFLVSHRAKIGSEPDTSEDLMAGTALAWGGMARRDDPAKSWAFKEDYLKNKQKIAMSRGESLQYFSHLDSKKVIESESQMWQSLLKRFTELPHETSAELASELSLLLNSKYKRELYSHAVTNYPTQPATLPAYRWLAQYHASTETLRRIELGQMTSLRPTEFYELPPSEIQQASHTDGKAERAKFRTSEAQRGWYGTGPNLEANLYAVNPLIARDPVQQLAIHAARMKLGLTADAEKALAGYYTMVVGRPIVPGANPWFDAVAAELHIMNPKLMPTNPKPMTSCVKIASRPVLDGVLDDEAWKETTEFALKNGDREYQASHGTSARMAFDDEYLYLAVTCRHPKGEAVAVAEKRKHDDDVASHDRVEMLLDLDRDYSTYYRLRIDQRGCTAEDCWGDVSWNPQWFVAVKPSESGWTAEVAIPLAELTGTRPYNKQVWAMNLSRVLPGRGVMSWSGPADATPRPEGMGLLEFQSKER